MQVSDTMGSNAISHGQVAQLVERSPEKAGVGGSIPSLATTLTLVYSTRARLFFRLCQICAVDSPNQVVL